MNDILTVEEIDYSKRSYYDPKLYGTENEVDITIGPKSFVSAWAKKDGKSKARKVHKNKKNNIEKILH